VNKITVRHKEENSRRKKRTSPKPTHTHTHTHTHTGYSTDSPLSACNLRHRSRTVVALHPSKLAPGRLNHLHTKLRYSQPESSAAAIQKPASGKILTSEVADLISDFIRGVGYVACGLPTCDNVQSSDRNTEATGPQETLVTTYTTIWRCNPTEIQNGYFHHISHMSIPTHPARFIILIKTW
jgi:hypothetical protein